jgi:hypothetical protein
MSWILHIVKVKQEKQVQIEMMTKYQMALGDKQV